MATASDDPLLVAGGGGGGGAACNGGDADLGPDAMPGSNWDAGGSNGHGAPYTSHGCGGAGFLTDAGQGGSYCTIAPVAFVNGGRGGFYDGYTALTGGFGGGAPSHGNCEPGGGGGYSGGNANWHPVQG